MDGMIKLVFILAFILWLPLFVCAIASWFMPIELGYKIVYTVLALAIWIPPIGAIIDTNRY